MKRLVMLLVLFAGVIGVASLSPLEAAECQTDSLADVGGDGNCREFVMTARWGDDGSVARCYGEGYFCRDGSVCSRIRGARVQRLRWRGEDGRMRCE